MKVDIYIKERNGNREIRIPWLPEEIKYDSGGAIVATYDIVDRGEVAVPTGSGLATISWSSEFPGRYRTDDSMMRGRWKNPKTYHNILESWKLNGTPLNLMVIGYPINFDVYLEKYTCTPTGGFGDLAYEVAFVEQREITITSTKVPTPARSTTTASSYTVKSGDTLWGIAAMSKHYGDGSQWGKIYDANKEIIESTAKKRWKAAGIDRDSEHGYWIFPGTVLTIPGK